MTKFWTSVLWPSFTTPCTFGTFLPPWTFGIVLPPIISFSNLSGDKIMWMDLGVKNVLKVSVRVAKLCQNSRCQIFVNIAVEKVDKEQLNRKRFEIYQTSSCFRAFWPTSSLNNVMKLASKSVKLNRYIHRNNIENTLVKILPT